MLACSGAHTAFGPTACPPPALPVRGRCRPGEPVGGRDAILAGRGAMVARAPGAPAGGRCHVNRPMAGDAADPAPRPVRQMLPAGRAAEEMKKLGVEERRFHHHSVRLALGQHGQLHASGPSPARTRCSCCRPAPIPEDQFIVDARNTRLGFDVLGPEIPFFNCAQGGGKVEIDFQQNRVASRPRTSRASCCAMPMPK